MRAVCLFTCLEIFLALVSSSRLQRFPGIVWYMYKIMSDLQFAEVMLSNVKAVLVNLSVKIWAGIFCREEENSREFLPR